MAMTGFSIHQPWAELIVAGRKSIEIRTWRSRVQLPMLVAIHAGKTPDWGCPAGLFWKAGFDPTIEVTERADEYLRQRLGGIIGAARFVERIEFGGYLGEIEGRARWERLASEHLNLLDQWADNLVGFRFDQPVRFPEIIPCKGHLGFWSVPSDVEARVRRMLADSGAQEATRAGDHQESTGPEEPGTGETLHSGEGDVKTGREDSL